MSTIAGITPQALLDAYTKAISMPHLALTYYTHPEIDEIWTDDPSAWAKAQGIPTTTPNDRALALIAFQLFDYTTKATNDGSPLHETTSVRIEHGHYHHYPRTVFNIGEATAWINKHMAEQHDFSGENPDNELLRKWQGITDRPHAADAWDVANCAIARRMPAHIDATTARPITALPLPAHEQVNALTANGQGQQPMGETNLPKTRPIRFKLTMNERAASDAAAPVFKHGPLARADQHASADGSSEQQPTIQEHLGNTNLGLVAPATLAIPSKRSFDDETHTVADMTEDEHETELDSDE